MILVSIFCFYKGYNYEALMIAFSAKNSHILHLENRSQNLEYFRIQLLKLFVERLSRSDDKQILRKKLEKSELYYLLGYRQSNQTQSIVNQWITIL